MQETKFKSTGERRRPQDENAGATPLKSAPAWKPEPCILSHDELRDIVAEIMD
jgi:hypothetical protein